MTAIRDLWENVKALFEPVLAETETPAAIAEPPVEVAEQTPVAPVVAQRALGISDVYQQLQAALPVANETATPDTVAYMVDLFVDSGQLVALLNQGGKLYRAPVGIAGGVAQLSGTPEPVEVNFAPTMRSRVTVARLADGRVRWFALVGTNVLNRSAQIDSAALYADLVRNFRAGGEPVYLDFFHEGPLILGHADWLDTDGHALVASGLLDDNELARAYLDASAAGRGQWGCSISYMPSTEPRNMEIVPGVTIPVYEAGVLRRIAVLPEDKAASWFTAIGVEVKRMKKDVEDALKVLFGDEEKAKAFVASIDATNRSIDEQGLVTRTVLGEAEVRRIVAEAVAALPKPEPIAPAVVDFAPVNAILEALTARVAALETAETERQNVRRQDMPAPRNAEVTFRPRMQRQAGEQSAAQIAEATLAKLRPAGAQGAK
jgi:hypothetical protein